MRFEYYIVCFFSYLFVSIDLEFCFYFGFVRFWKYKVIDVRCSIIICILEIYFYEVGLVFGKIKIW